MNFRQPPSKYKNQILTPLKRDAWQSELDLTKDSIGNDSARTIQASHDTLIFSCGTGVGFTPLHTPGKYGFQHAKVSCGQVSDIHVNPFIQRRLVAVTTTDQTVRVYEIPKNLEELASPIHECRASSGSTTTPVLVMWHPQVEDIFTVASGSKVDVFKLGSTTALYSIDIISPCLTADWSHDGRSILVLSKDSQLRIIDPRGQRISFEDKHIGNKPVLRSLPGHFIISSLSKSRERQLRLYPISSPGNILKDWTFGTASTPLIPVVDAEKKIVYLTDKSGATLRWIELVSPFNEGACSTSIEQSSSACLIHSLGLELMEGEVNRLIIADTKGNTVPIKITIGRKSYLEFHDDIYTDIPIASGLISEQWAAGKDGSARFASITPKLATAAKEAQDLSAYLKPDTTQDIPKESITRAQTEPLPKTKPNTQVQNATKAPTQQLSAREQRKWDKAEVKGTAIDKEAHSVDVTKETSTRMDTFEHDPHPRVADGVLKKNAAIPAELTTSNNLSVIDSEEALEKLRLERVTPALERLGLSQTVEVKQDSLPKQILREVVKEDLSARRAEYGAIATKEVYKEDLSARRAEYGANSTREVYKEDLTARRAEYGATKAASPVKVLPSQTTVKSTSATKPESVLSARDQRKWDKENVSPAREVYREDRSARRAEYGAKPASSKVVERARSPSPAPPVRMNTAEREVYKEDLSARRAEYGATPVLDGPSTASKEMLHALNKVSIKSNEPKTEPSRETLENAYAVPAEKPVTTPSKAPVSNGMVEKEASIATITPKTSAAPNPRSAVREIQSEQIPPQSRPTTSSSGNSAKVQLSGLETAHKDYTRKYLTGKMHHPRNSYTNLTSLNASLPNTARMVDATDKHILFPLAGPGGRLGLVSATQPGRLSALIPGFVGGATVSDFELDRFVHDRFVSAHIDQSIRVWHIPTDMDADMEKAEHVISGLDKILAMSFHPLSQGLLMATTTTKIHLFDLDKREELKTFVHRGIANSTWSLDGQQIALGLSDKSVKILDARTGETISQFPSAHVSTRPFRVAFVGKERLVTAGFGKGSARQVALYSITGNVLQVIDLDISPSPFSLPYFDEMSSILYLVPRGTSNILPFFINNDSITALPAYSAADPVMGAAFLPAQLLSTREVEIARCLRMTTNEISVVGFYIPRPAGEFFHDDIYPTTVKDAYVPSGTAAEWMTGEQPSSHPVYQMNKDNLKPATSTPAKKASTPAKATVKADVQADKGNELNEMFNKAKGQDGDEPEYQNNASNTRWD